MIIDLPRFIAQERPAWTELEALLDTLQNRTTTFDYSAAQRLFYLYQKVSADLARLHTFASEPELRHYLEALVARAYAEIHGREARRERWRPLRWFLHEFPAAFRRHAGAFHLTIYLTLAGMAFGGFAVALDPDAKDALVPAQFGHLNGDPSERVQREEHRKATAQPGATNHAIFASMLMTNNIKVAIIAMALGMIWGGFGTMIVLFYNGIIMGVVALDYLRAGQGLFLFGWLMPHGVIEIPAILLGAQAGFVLSTALLRRRERSTLAARLRRVGPDVISLIGGVAVMLVWAGLVESFLSQYHEPIIPYWSKITFGVLELTALCWLLYARKNQPEPALA